MLPFKLHNRPLFSIANGDLTLRVFQSALVFGMTGTFFLFHVINMVYSLHLVTPAVWDEATDGGHPKDAKEENDVLHLQVEDVVTPFSCRASLFKLNNTIAAAIAMCEACAFVILKIRTHDSSYLSQVLIQSILTLILYCLQFRGNCFCECECGTDYIFVFNYVV